MHAVCIFTPRFIDDSQVATSQPQLRDADGTVEAVNGLWMFFDPGTLTLSLEPPRERGGRSLSLSIGIAVEALGLRSQLLFSFDIQPSLNVTIVEDGKMFVQTPAPLVEVTLALADPSVGFIIPEAPGTGVTMAVGPAESGAVSWLSRPDAANAALRGARISWVNDTVRWCPALARAAPPLPRYPSKVQIAVSYTHLRAHET